MNRTRGFEVVSAWKDKDIRIPCRKTAQSAGYDIESAVDTDLEPGQIHVVPTGLKTYMKSDEYLSLHIRSSLGIKHGIMLANNTGIIDADYYNNEDNEGHIMCALYNAKDEVFHIRRGDRIAQGIFVKYYVADGDEESGKRTGGIGSTGV